MRTAGFTTYGPLLTDPAAFRGGSPDRGGSPAQDSVGWLATADFRSLTTDRLATLAAAAGPAPKALMADPAFAGRATATTDLPAALGQLRQALLVNRSTILIVALQLILLAGYALLLVARMLSTERAGETALLRARGGSRRRIAGLALAEALLLAAPAAAGAPPLAGPLIQLLSAQGALARIGVTLDTRLTASSWLTGLGVALGCALAVAAPALLRTGADGPRRRRGRALPGAPLGSPARSGLRTWGRTGADLGLLVIAGVAYWQLRRQTAGGAGSGALSADAAGQLGIDPVLVAAPALALLAGTVLTLRLLPLAARLAERGAARGRGRRPRWPAGRSAAARCAAPDRCCCWCWRPRWACWRSARARPGTVRRTTRPTSARARRCAYWPAGHRRWARAARTNGCPGWPRRCLWGWPPWICPTAGTPRCSRWTPGGRRGPCCCGAIWWAVARTAPGAGRRTVCCARWHRTTAPRRACNCRRTATGYG